LRDQGVIGDDVPRRSAPSGFIPVQRIAVTVPSRPPRCPQWLTDLLGRHDGPSLLGPGQFCLV